MDATNLATQGYYIDDIGKLKIDALSQSLLRINPEVQIKKSSKNFLELQEKELIELIGGSNLILMMTDDFNAQKRGNLFALKYKIPAVFALMYEKAKGAEVVFTIPGVTPACYRCAVSSRYKAYEQGYQNDVTSQGSNSLQTHYLNSVIGLIALSMLHCNNKTVNLGGWYPNNWEKNLLQLRLHPDYENKLFQQSGNPRAFCFDSVWQSIDYEAPPKYDFCPDCGGHGDLMKVTINHSI